MMHLRRCLLPLLGCALLAAALPAQDDIYQIDLQDGERKLLKGELTSSANIFDELLLAWEEEEGADRPSADIVRAARVGLWEIALRRGKYEEVLKQTGGQPGPIREHRSLRLLRVRALSALGRYPEAAALLRALCEADGGDLEARWRLGVLLRETGQRDDARAQWQAAVDHADRNSLREALPLAWLGRCLHEMGGRRNLEAASAFLADSMRVAPQRPEARTTQGQIYFEAYGEAATHPSGEKFLAKVLDNNGDVEEALLALYRLRRTNYQLDPGKTEKYLERALALNPRSVPALIERGSVVLDDRRFEDAAEILDRALEINPNDKWALAHRAAAAYLRNQQESYRQLREQALAVDPTFAEVDRVLADHLVALYRFGDAVPFYRSVIAAEPESIATLHGMAKALIYTGAGHEAVELLEQAKELQPGFVSPWRSNALAVETLLAEQYTTLQRGGFEFTMHRDDVDVMQQYLLPLQLEALEQLGQKYDYRPDRAVKVEMFHTWDDFSVRTIGFRGFTALGACFGPFITLVSPRDGDLRKQEFMWAATVWHEYTHVLTLGLSRHRVPRWLTEGFSVYEERQRDPAWERGMDRELFDAFYSRDIPPVRLLNRLFRGPRILFGYYQGGLIVELLAREHGFPKVIEMLRAYGEDLSTEQVFQKVLDVSTSAFDRKFLEFVEKEKLRGMKLVPRFDNASIDRMAVQLARDPDNLQVRINLAWAFVQRNNPVDAGNQLAEVLRRNSEYGPALLLRAELFRRRSATDDALAHYERGFARGAEDFDSRMAYGTLLEQRGDLEAAMDQYSRAKACWPRCTEQQSAPELALARLHQQAGRETEAMMELKSYCRRTARAFGPRIRLAEYERGQGNRAAEAAYLEDCVRIDPFMRELHLKLADAYLELDKRRSAVRELEVALAVPPALDRAYLGDPESVPAADSDGEKDVRAQLCLRLARLFRQLDDQERALSYLDRAIEEAPASDAAGQARALRAEWGGKR